MIRDCGCSRPSARISGQASTKSPSAPVWRMRTFRRSTRRRSILLLRLPFRLGVRLTRALGASAITGSFARVGGLRACEGILVPRLAVAGGGAQIRIERPPPVSLHAALHELHGFL